MSACWRLGAIRPSVNSRPRKKSRNTSPISATKSVTSDGRTRLSTFGSFGAEQEPREQVGRDRGQAQAARHEPKASEQADGDREFGERHRPVRASLIGSLHLLSRLPSAQRLRWPLPLAVDYQ